MSRPRPRLHALLVLLAPLALSAPGSAARAGQSNVSDDGAWASCRAVEGTVVIRGALADRGEPLDVGGRLRVGDVIDTAALGSHAVELRDDQQNHWLLGPGSTLRVTADGPELLRGELAILEGEAALLGPSGAVRTGPAPSPWRVSDGELRRQPSAPGWLRSWMQRESAPALGALLARIDGREVPLSIGFHHVRVDIHDLVARTVIEQSFQNHTDEDLEGVFYFPMPAGASVSDFAVWTGREWIEAEVVEKQRARQIYETLLREKKDPGLLEWSGGNVFKARVHPIEKRRAKKIRLQYTQVLERQDGVSRYRYALQSDSLQAQPIERLAVEVHVHSSAPLDELRCTSHACAQENTAHAASLRYEVEQARPERDFELILRSAPQPGVRAFHRYQRGDEGYFMALCEVEALAAERDPRPAQLMLMIDTSASLDGEGRERQLAFVDALLSLLGEEDRVQVATCDTETRYLFPGPQPVSRALAADVARRLRETRWLGWSDLGRAWNEVAAAGADRRVSGPGTTQIVYVGDGIDTAGQGDRAELLRKREAAAASFHAVSIGDGADLVSLRRLVSGGGCLLRAESSSAPTLAARLLRELSSPGPSKLRLDLGTNAVAAVHPAELARVAAGSSFVVVGRWDPRAGPLQGRVVLRGERDGRPVEYALELPPADEAVDTSFLARLWARAELEALQREADAEGRLEQIVALSEEYRVLTPWTSFLVVEDETERRRFQLEKSLRRRDGEDYFTAAREDARAELRADVAQRARSWRIGLARQLAEELEDMGREETGRLESRTIDSLSSVVLSVDEPLFEVEKARFTRGDRFEAEFDLEEAQGAAAAPVVHVAARYADPAEASKKRRQDLRGGSILERRAPGNPAGPGSPGPGLFFQPPQPAASLDPFSALLPLLPTRPQEPLLPPWSDELRELLRTLDRRAVLAKGHWSIEARSRDGDQAEAREGWTLWLGEAGWLIDHRSASAPASGLQWCLDGRRGASSATWGIAVETARGASEALHSAWPAPFPLHFGELSARLDAYDVHEERREDGLVHWRLVHHEQPADELRLSFHPEQRLVRELEERRDGRVLRRQSFTELAEVGGLWWPTRIETWTAADDRRSILELQITSGDSGQFQRETAQALAHRDQCLLLSDPPASRSEALHAFAADQRDAASLWSLRGFAAAEQNWDEAGPYHAALRELASGPARRAMHAQWLLATRDHAALLQELEEAAELMAATPSRGELTRSRELLDRFAAPLSGGERLELLQTLRPVVERHDAIPGVSLHHELREIEALAAAGRREDATLRTIALPNRHPQQVEAWLRSATTLAEREALDAALTQLDKARSSGSWTREQRRRLQDRTVELMAGRDRLDELCSAVEAWMRDDASPSHTTLERYLVALAFTGRADRAWSTAERWMLPEAATDDSVRQRFVAGLNLVAGRCRDLYSWRATQRTRNSELLARCLHHVVDRPELYDALDGVIQGRLLGSEAGRGFTRRLMDRIEAELPRAEAPRLRRWMSWTRIAASGLPVEPEWFVARARQVEERRRRSDDRREQRVLADLVRSHGDRATVLDLCRERLDRGEADERDLAFERFATLVLHDEASDLEELRELGERSIPRMADLEGRDPDGRKHAQVVLHLQAIGDAVVRRARTPAELEAAEQVVRDRAATIAAAERAARETAAELLAGLPVPAGHPLEAWVRIERCWFEIQSGRFDPATVDAIVRWYQEARASAIAAVERGDDDARLRQTILAGRTLSTLMQLAVVDAPPEEAGALEQRVHELARTASLDDDGPIDGRRARWILWTVLDRPQLEAAMMVWHREDLQRGDTLSTAQLARHFVERDALEDAVLLLEHAAEHQALPADLLHEKADWLAALGREEAAHRARVEAHGRSSEWTLAREVLEPLGGRDDAAGRVSPVLDPDTAAALVALFEKARDPARRMEVLQRWYRATRDPRVFDGIAEATRGHSAQGVYRLLGAVKEVVAEVDEEAALEHLRASWTERRRQPGLRVLDQRALDLLEFLGAARAVRLGEGDPRRVRSAQEAMLRLAQTELGAEERTLLATFFVEQGALPGPLAELRRVLLEGFLVETEAVGDARLELSLLLARLERDEGEALEAARIVEAALNVRGRRFGGLDDTAFDRWCVLLREAGRHREGERQLLARLEAAPDEASRDRLHRQMRAHVLDAIREGAGLSLGQGAELVRELIRRDVEEMLVARDAAEAADDVRRFATLVQTAAERHGVEVWGPGLRRFAREELPRVLNRFHHRRADSMVGTTAQLLRDRLGSKEALVFLLDRAENEPQWLAWVDEDFWSNHGRRIAHDRQHAGEIPATVAERLWSQLRGALRRDVLEDTRRTTAFTNRSQASFWSERGDEMLRVLDEIARAPQTPTPVLMRAARRMIGELRRAEPALAALAIADRGGRLAPNDRHRFVDWLQQAERWAESVAVLEDLARSEDSRPADPRWIRALGKVGRREEAAAALATLAAASDDLDVVKLTQLGSAARDAGLPVPAAELARLAIDRRQLHHALGTQDDPSLAAAYRVLRDAENDRQQSWAAVQAAAGVMLAFPGDRDQRARAFDELGALLRSVEELGPILAALDDEVERSGVENPLLRKALGQSLLQRQDEAGAIHQLRASLEAFPADRQTQESLIEALAKAQPEALSAELFRLAARYPREPELFRRLARELRETDEAEAHRALSSMVEHLPEEASSHRLLAEECETLERWELAESQWQEVVRLRGDEPAGYLGLARVRIQRGAPESARPPLEKLLRTSWPERFGDVSARARELERRLPSGGGAD